MLQKNNTDFFVTCAFNNRWSCTALHEWEFQTGYRGINTAQVDIKTRLERVPLISAVASPEASAPYAGDPVHPDSYPAAPA